MLGKASEIRISDALKGCSSVRWWITEHPDRQIIEIKISPTLTGESDYFYIIYKEASQ